MGKNALEEEGRKALRGPLSSPLGWYGWGWRRQIAHREGGQSRWSSKLHRNTLGICFGIQLFEQSQMSHRQQSRCQPGRREWDNTACNGSQVRPERYGGAPRGEQSRRQPL